MASPLDATSRRFRCRSCRIHRISTELVWSQRVQEFGQRRICGCSVSACDSRQRATNTRANVDTTSPRNSLGDSVTDARVITDIGERTEPNAAADTKSEGHRQHEGDRGGEREGNPQADAKPTPKATAKPSPTPKPSKKPKPVVLSTTSAKPHPTHPAPPKVGPVLPPPTVSTPKSTDTNSTDTNSTDTDSTHTYTDAAGRTDANPARRRPHRRTRYAEP